MSNVIYVEDEGFITWLSEEMMCVARMADQEIDGLCSVLAQTAAGITQNKAVRQVAINALKWHGYSALVAEYGLEE